MATHTLRERVGGPVRAMRRAARGLRGDGPSPTEAPAPARPDRLLTMPLFSDLSPSEAAILSLFMTRSAVPAGTVVVQQGGEDADFYLIEDGQAEVRLRDDAGQTTPLAKLGPGEYFGEIAFVTGEPRTADVVALTPLTLLRVSRDGYDALAQLSAVEELLHTAEARAALTRAELAHRSKGAAEAPAS
jgi:CRP-like cAMP-binding protein